MTLKGGGSRARKAARNLPLTPAAVARAHNALPHREPHLPAKRVLAVSPHWRNKLCVVFVRREPGRRGKPYNVVEMCNGGGYIRTVSEHKTRAEANVVYDRIRRKR